jgi:hypothetical protein
LEITPIFINELIKINLYWKWDSIEDWENIEWGGTDKIVNYIFNI